MVSTSVVVVSILGSILVLVAGHFIITKVLPLLKDLLKSIIKDEKAINALLSIFIIYVAVFAIGKLIPLLVLLEFDLLTKFTEIINPGLALLLDVVPYLQWLVLGVIVVIGLKNYR